jgi:hypothetical protein
VFEKFDCPVRCREGHVFTTIWVPLASLKSVRLGTRRYQHCPVGRHWTIIEPIDPTSADPTELARAAAVHDIHIP